MPRLLRVSALCLAIGAAMPAHALGLGSAQVLSSIGQPLRADIPLRDFDAHDADTLKVFVAPPSAFAARQLSYSSQLEQLSIRIVRSPDGSAVLQLRGTSAVNEPFIDVLLRATWAGGELTRDYTLLFDPPGFHEPAPPSAIAAQTGAQAAPKPAVRRAPATPQPASARRAAPSHRPLAAAAPAGTTRYRVRAGDTLGSIAQRLGVEQVSLDQMLVALYRANSGAFIDHNMNLLRAGAVLRVPDAASAAAVPAPEAQREVIAQSRDFGAYRRRLAQVAAQAAPRASAPTRRSAGRIEAEVTTPTPTASQPQSRLKLSKPNEGGEQAAEASRIAAQSQAAALEARLAAARASVAELSRLAASAAAAANTASAPAAPAAPAVVAPPSSAPAAARSPAPSPAASQHHAAVAVAPAVPAPAAKPSVQGTTHPTPPKSAAPRVAPSLSWTDTLLANPLLLPGAAGVLALLGLLLWLRRRAAARSARDSSVFDSRMTAADSFFGGSGGERVDTRNSTLGSSIAYSPSQLDSGDVDPVAEADVYLAYGRDLQAEEILKESLKTHPERNAARLKLLEIYARRKDVRSFEMTAAELFTLTEGTGPDWKKAQDLGRNLDPVNPLYHNTQPPSSLNSPSTVPLGDLEPGASTLDVPAATLPATELMSVMRSPEPSAPPVAPVTRESQAQQARPMHGLDLDLDLSAAAPAEAALELPAALEARAPELPDLAADDLEPVTLTPAEPHDDASHAPLDFDFGGLSLDLAPAASTPPEAPSTPEPRFDHALELLASDAAGDAVDTLQPPVEPSAAVEAPIEAAASPATEAAVQPPAERGTAPASPLHFELELPQVDGAVPPPREPAVEVTSSVSSAVRSDATTEAHTEATVNALSEPATEAPEHAAAAEVVDTRFALVDECRAMGDAEMARDLLREIVAEGDAASRQRAEAMLAELG